MYRYLPKSVGLRRITLHKSMSQGDKMYLLICECSQLQDNLSAAAILLPALRARLCGYIGLYRPSVCFWFLTRLLESARSIFSNCITHSSAEKSEGNTEHNAAEDKTRYWFAEIEAVTSQTPLTNETLWFLIVLSIIKERNFVYALDESRRWSTKRPACSIRYATGPICIFRLYYLVRITQAQR